jgi:hypothetical protein
LLLLAFLAFSCGSSGFDVAGGGTGGTGISTGAISGFGSVVVNGVHFRTDDDVAPGFKTKKVSRGTDKSGRPDKDVFAVGMVVTVRHEAGGSNAAEIEYRSNLLGPVAGKNAGADGVAVILGQSVVVDNAALFGSLAQGETVEVSGFADSAGRIRAVSIIPVPPPVAEFEINGFVSGRSPSGAAFRLGPLPGGSGATVEVSFGPEAISGLPGGPADGMYVQVVTADREPAGGVITATRITKLAARTEFPEGAAVDLEGLITTAWSGQPNDLSIAVEGKRVRWNSATEFDGGSMDDLRRTDGKVLVQGKETGGTLSAARIVFR